MNRFLENILIVFFLITGLGMVGYQLYASGMRPADYMPRFWYSASSTAAPNGSAAYISGEACVINADIDDDEYLRNLEFCWYEHTGRSLWAYEPPMHVR